MIIPKLISILLAFVVLAGCSEDKQSEHEASGNYYTCPMHPSVRSDRPGACPICGMDLVPKAVAAGSEHANMVHISLREEKRAGIETDSVKTGSVTSGRTFPGRIVTNPASRKVITAPIGGKIIRLQAKSPYQTVKAGNVLFELYSEELNSDLREYRVLKEKATDEFGMKLLAAAKNKLILWGLSESEIESGSSYTSKFLANESGIVETININEGSWVNKGEAILELATFDRVWAELNAYPGEAFNGRIYIRSNRGEITEGRMVLDPPALGSGQSRRTYFEIDNRKGGFTPGEEVTILSEARIDSAIVIPVNAVIPGEMKTVWLKTGRGMYEPVMVTTGESGRDSIEITSGLKPGDRVVVKGAYLLNSEYILQKGAGAAHNH